jgi:hypothetical protein
MGVPARMYTCELDGDTGRGVGEERGRQRETEGDREREGEEEIGGRSSFMCLGQCHGLSWVPKTC